MFCNKCGRRIEENTKFCGGCGTPVPVQNYVQQNENTTQNIETPNTQQNYNVNQNNGDFRQAQVNTNYNQPYQNYDNIVNPSMKKYAILSIVIPAVSIFVYLFIGLTVYIAIFLSALGFNFAKKGALYSKKLSRIGYVLNTILIVMAVLVWIVLLIATFA